MKQGNIRTVNGLPHNGVLATRYQRVQNRAAAVIDAWVIVEQEGSTGDLFMVGHMHQLSINQISKDLYGDPVKIKRRFGLESTGKLDRALEKCVKEVAEGTNEALVALANYIPFILLITFPAAKNKKEHTAAFLRDMKEKFNSKTREEIGHRTDSTSAVRSMHYL